ncbi:hypothetical protein BsWGS_13918 [Bradybaena similaris]
MKTHKAQSGKSTIKVKARVERPSTSSDSSDDSYSDSFSDSDDTSDRSDTGDTDSTCSTGSSDCSGSRSDSSPSSSCSSSSSSEESTPTPRKIVKTSVCNTGNRLLLKKSPLPKSRHSTLNTSKFGGKGRKNTHDIGNKQTNTKKTTKRMKCQDIRETSKSGNAKTSALKRTKEKKHQTVKVKRISSATARSRSETGSASGESQTRPVAGCKSGMKRSFSQSSSANPGLKDMATKCKTAKCRKT